MYHVPGIVLSGLHVLLSLQTAFGARYSYPYFTNEDHEAQRS